MFTPSKASLLFALLFLSTASQAQTPRWRALVSEDFGTTLFAPPDGISSSSTPASNLLPGITDYTAFIPPADNPGAGPIAAASYKVTTWSGRVEDFNWVRAWDHSTNNGTGFMMQINADPSKRGEATGAYYVYSTAAFDIPGANYRVGFYAANILSTVAPSAVRDAYIGVSIRNTPNASGTLYGGGDANSEWILPRTTIPTNKVLPWEQKIISFSLPTNYVSPTPLYFTFYNTEPSGGDGVGNDIALDDILIEMQVVSLSGTVFHDLNKDGILAGLDVGVNGVASPMYVYVIKSDGKVVSRTNVKADGTYQFSAENGVPFIPAAAGDVGLKLVLSTQDIAEGEMISNTVSTTTGFVKVSENKNGSTGMEIETFDDGFMRFTNSSLDFANINFGVNALPESYNITKSINGSPVIGQSIPLTDQPLQGSDPISSPTAGSWATNSILITSLPTNGFDVYYNGVKITAADIGSSGFRIDNYDPSKLTVQATGSTPMGTANTSFTYSVIDNQNASDPTPASYDITFTQPLPAVFGDINATLNGNALSVLWTVLKEQNNAYFDVEASVDGVHFASLGRVATIATDGNSDRANNYRFSASLSGQSFVAGASLLALLLALPTAGKRSRKILGAAIVLIGLSLVNMACNKKNDATVDVSGKNLFVRITQVDKDGTKSYSKIIKVKKQ